MIHIFDGAMGTMLQAGGLKPGACPELMNIDAPEVVRAIHEEYIAAGATIIETNTFGASRLKLAHYGLENRMEEINAAAVRIAKEAAGTRAKVAGSMGPTGRFIEPLGDLGFEEAYEGFREQAKALADAGADYLIIETCIDIQEMRAALLAAKEVTDLPIICQLSYSEDGRTVTGTDPESAAVILDGLGADVIGVNCSLGPEELVPVVKTLAASCRAPISVQPNAGMPFLRDGKTCFPTGPEEFGTWGPKLLAAGATYLGGCCGTTPAHIKALAESVRGLAEPVRAQGRRLLLCRLLSGLGVFHSLPRLVALRLCRLQLLGLLGDRRVALSLGCLFRFLDRRRDLLGARVHRLHGHVHRLFAQRLQLTLQLRRALLRGEGNALGVLDLGAGGLRRLLRLCRLCFGLRGGFLLPVQLARRFLRL